jgi:hypothetical protein
MCVIAYKPRGIKVMDKTVLESCWNSNSDGAGMAWYDHEAQMWQVRKGYMTWKKFWKAYKSQNFTDDDIVVCHFRISTSGLKDGGNTHPFPVIEDCVAMREMSYACDSILFHNGVVGRGEGDFSDTMIHIRDYIAPIVDKLGTHEKMPLIFTKLLEGASRWILTKGDKLWRFGNTWHDENGWLFSNLTFKPSTYTYTSIYTNGKWQDNVKQGDYHSGLKNPKWRNHTDGYANEYGRMVNGKWVMWTKEEKEGIESVATDFTKATDHTNDDGTINFSKARKRKGKTKNKDKEVHTRSVGGESLFCVVEEDGTFKWGEKSKEYLRYRAPQFLICPNCYEDKHIGCYGGDHERSVCQHCGAIFADYTGEILMFDLEIYSANKNSSISKITEKPSNFAKLTPAEKQAIIDSETEEMLHYNYI